MKTYEEYQSKVRSVVFENVGINETYIVSDIHARLSIYLVDGTEDLKNHLYQELKEIIERVHIIDKDGFIYKDLNNTNYEEPEKLYAEKNIFYVDRHINLLNWSLRNNRYASTAPISCFYSFKGGLGRTTAMVLSAICLAREGKKVALLDFDLEAPGLMHIFSNDFHEIKNFRGVIDYLIDLSSLKDDGKLDIGDYYYTINKQEIVGSNGGELLIFSAGQTIVDENLYMSKFSKLNSIYISNNEFHIDKLFNNINSKLSPDFIFVDTRTGLNDWGGLFMSRYAKNAFLFFFGTSQNMFGLETILPKLKSINDLNFYLVNSPVPKIEELARQEKGLYLEVSYDLFSKLYYEDDKVPFIEDETAAHYPIDIPYDELAVLLNSSDKLRGLVEKDNGENPYLKIAKLVNTDLFSSSQNTNLTNGEDKKDLIEVISHIAPDLAAAEYEFEDLDKLKSNFYPRKDYKFIFDKTKYLILGEKGVGKTALFAVLNNHEYAKALGKFCEVKDTDLELTSWIKGLDEKGSEFPQQSTFSEVGTFSISQQRVFWKMLIIKYLQNENIGSWASFLIEIPAISEISIDDQLKLLDAKFSHDGEIKVLIYDYLDKLISEDNGKRGEIIGSLLDVWRDMHVRYNNIRSKIFLRKDIFTREVNLTDKVKLDNHKAEITWEYDQLLNVVWKRMWHNGGDDLTDRLFKNWIKEIDAPLIDILGIMPKATEGENRKFLNSLIGEYMGGNNKAFPYNWILYHVSDTAKKIHPRSLLNLFSGAAKLQIDELDFNTDYYLIPRYIELANKKVSERRVQDIVEEYPSLKEVFNKLQNHLERLPAEESTLKTAIDNLVSSESLGTTSQEIIKKLEDINVLYEYKFNRKGTEKKYHIPDLYLIGMGIKRIGPGAHKALFGKK
jgi:hypothetical protein